jgi:hypothetical protein
MKNPKIEIKINFIYILTELLYCSVVLLLVHSAAENCAAEIGVDMPLALGYRRKKDSNNIFQRHYFSHFLTASSSESP